MYFQDTFDEINLINNNNDKINIIKTLVLIVNGKQQCILFIGYNQYVQTR